MIAVVKSDKKILHPGEEAILIAYVTDDKGHKMKISPWRFWIGAKLGGKIAGKHFKVSGFGSFRRVRMLPDCPTPGEIVSYIVVAPDYKVTSANLRIPVR